MSLKSRIKIRNVAKLSDNHFQLDRYDIEYQRNDGTWQSQMREVYDCGDAATVLLYNLHKQTIVLIKQLRVPCFLNGHEAALLETPAGLLDGMSPEKRILEEIEEETGFRISKVEKIYDAFASPGALKSKTIFFIGEYADSDKIPDGGGLVDEGEEIEVIEMPFKAAVEMLENNEIQDMKTILLVQYAMLKLFQL
jgi:nudix-type nucleoside diphosphatase (YffH/AdpP family)